jgi:tetratricopeptide (TPR) repeat protein
MRPVTAFYETGNWTGTPVLSTFISFTRLSVARRSSSAIAACLPAAVCLLTAVVLAVASGGCGGSTQEKDPERPREQGATAAGDELQTEVLKKHQEQIAEHRALVQQGTQITDEQRARYADDYYEVGAQLWRAGQRAEAEPYFREAVRLWPQHARATARLGDLCALRRQFRAAAEAYQRATELEPDLAEAMAQRRTRLAEFVLAIADQRIDDYQIAGATEVLRFVEQYLNDVAGDKARERLKKIEPYLEAERKLNEGKEHLAHLRKEQAYKAFRGVAADYPRSYFAQEANRLLEENGQKLVLDSTATGYALPPTWRRTLTEHFEIYYEKRSGLTGAMRNAEEAYARIVRDFGMDDAEWKTRVRMYLFSDDESWREFLAMNQSKTMEWAGGFALPWANEIYVYVADRKSDLYKDTLPHELTHVLHYRYVGPIFQPLWLTEGLAVSQQEGGVKDARRAIDRLVRDGKAFPLSELFKLDYYPPRALHLFYAQSAAVVGFMIDEYGIDKLKEFLFEFTHTHDSAKAIESVYGIPLDTFERKWEKYVR